MYKCKLLSSEVSFPSEKDIQSIVAKTKSLSGQYIVVTNAHNQYLAHTNSDYLKTHTSAYLCISDSQILNLSSSFLYGKNVPKVFLGSNLMRIMCKATSSNINVGLYGSSEDIIVKLKENLAKINPNINITYAVSPPYRELSASELQLTIDEINQKKVDLLFVGLGCPKQEQWMHSNSSKLNCLSIGVGAAFDFIAYPTKEIPDYIHKFGFGSVFRMFKNTKLLSRYFIDGTKFMYHLFTEKFKINNQK
tara:strand:+ start:1050 stop:1796 length:747 start_codon:yes stop_codon:yes gene_type:complete